MFTLGIVLHVCGGDASYTPGLARLMHSWVMKLQRRSMYKAKDGSDIKKESCE